MGKSYQFGKEKITPSPFETAGAQKTKTENENIDSLERDRSDKPVRQAVLSKARRKVK